MEEYTLPYQIYVPEDYNEDTTEYPIVLFLHGAGERGDDNEAQLKNAVQLLFNDLDSPIYQSIFIAPQCPLEEQWVNTPWNEGNYDCDAVGESDSLKAVMALLEEVKEEYSINLDRIYVMGLSMGGFGTWNLMMRHTDIFAAAIPICGGADVKYAQVLAKKPIYTFHDKKDGTVPYAGTQAMVEAIRAQGGSLITFVETEGYGHAVWDYAVQYEGLMDWLFDQRLPG